MDWKSLFSRLPKEIPNVEIREMADVDNIGTIEKPLTLSDANAFVLANTVSEVFFPIDFLSDRASKIRYYIARPSGKEDKSNDLNRLIKAPNPFQGFGDYAYQYVFNMLADGNTVVYKGIPTSLSTVTFANLNRLDVLNPAFLSVEEYRNRSRLTASTLNNIIKKAEYQENNSEKTLLEIEQISIANIDSNLRANSLLFAKSPLYKAERAINTLLAAYSARYNVFANNGAAGYLVKRTFNENGIAAAVNPANRDAIMNDINDRHGLTGKKNLYGVSSIPLEFINTLITIKDLMPFDECLEDAIQIGGVYQLPPNLLPRKDQAKYENQKEAEISVWENAIYSIVDTFCKNTTKDMMLDKMGYSIQPDYSSVSVLQMNQITTEDIKAKKLANLKTAKEIAAETSPETIEKVNAQLTLMFE
jgi:hypothetical protein